MSWQAYIEMLIGDEKGVEAGIYGRDGTKWASSDNMDVEAAQITVLAGCGKKMASNGPKVGKIKCMMVKDDRENDKSYCLHLKGSKADGTQNVCVGQSLTAIVVCVGTPTSSLGERVYKVVEHLRKNKY